MIAIFLRLLSPPKSNDPNAPVPPRSAKNTIPPFGFAGLWGTIAALVAIVETTKVVCAGVVLVGLSVAGVKLQVTPLGRVPQPKVIVPLKYWSAVAVITNVALSPARTVADVGFADNV